MHVDSIPLFTGLLIFAASIISLRLGISVAIVEILLGSIAGNFGFVPNHGCNIWLVSAALSLPFLRHRDRYENDEKDHEGEPADRRHVFPCSLCCGRSHGLFPAALEHPGITHRGYCAFDDITGRGVFRSY